MLSILFGTPAWAHSIFKHVDPFEAPKALALALTLSRSLRPLPYAPQHIKSVGVGKKMTFAALETFAAWAHSIFKHVVPFRVSWALGLMVPYGI